jgi:hypothetical protein
MEITEPRRIFYLFVFLTALSLFLPLPGLLRLVPGIVQAFVLPGLVALMFFGDRNRPKTDDIFFAPILSPILLTLTVLAASRVFDDFDVAYRVAAGVFYLLFALAVFLKKDRPGESSAPIPTGVFFLSVFYGLFLIFMYFINDFLLIRSDAWYHASVINQIAWNGIPPLEPNLPGVAIRYMWIYHLFIASFKGLSGLSLFRAMSILNIAGGFALPYLAARTVSFFVRESRKIFASTLIVVAGLESASWIVWPTFLLRAFTGEVRGMDEVRRYFADISLKGQGPLDFLSPFGTWMVNLNDKFITITPFGYSLDLFLLGFILFASAGYIRDTRLRAGVMFFIVSLGTFLFHIITGTVLICSLIGAGVLIPIIEKYARGNQKLSLYWLVPAAAVLAAAMIGFPYFISLGGGAAGEGSLFSEIFHFGVKNIATIVLPLIILFLPARHAIRKILTASTREYAIMLAWIIPLLMLNVLVDLPTRNESKLVYPLFLLLGSVISVEIVEMIANTTPGKKKVMIALVLLLFFVPVFLTFRGFLIADTEGHGVLIARYEAYKGDKGIYEWMMDNTSENSVVIENGVNHLMPAFAGRRNFSGKSTLWSVLGYDKDYLAKHQALNRQLFACDSIAEGTIESIRETGLDLYVAVFSVDIKSCPALGDRFDSLADSFEPVYTSEVGKLYRLK